jgi:hypothetical protein
MLSDDGPECQVEDGRVVCDTDQRQSIDVGAAVPEDRAVAVEQEFQKRQQAMNEDRGPIRDWLNEPELDSCYSKYRRTDGELEREFVCIEKHRHERIKEGAKELSKTIAPSP